MSKGKAVVPRPTSPGQPPVSPRTDDSTGWLDSFSRGKPVFTALAIFLLSLPVFSRLVGGSPRLRLPDPDYLIHLGLVINLAGEGKTAAAPAGFEPEAARAAVRLTAEEKSPPHPLFHYCVLLLGFGYNPATIGRVMAVVLALATGARAYLIALLLTARNALSLRTVMATCLAAVLVMPLPNWWCSPRTHWADEANLFLAEMPSPGWWSIPSFFWGQVSPNVWHNPTAIFAMPFALALFLVGVRALESPRLSIMAGVGGAMVLSLLAKPNYVLAFAPCFAVAALVAYNREVRAGRLNIQDVIGHMLVAFVPALVVLAFQYQSAFAAGRSTGVKVVIAPLAAWSGLSPHIPFSLLLGIAFPLVVAILYPRQVVRDANLVLAWAVLAVAVGQFALLTETGVRSGEANFGWGADIADQVLFVVSCDFLLRQPANNSRRAAFAVLGLHVLCGCLCLARCLFVPALARAF